MISNEKCNLAVVLPAFNEAETISCVIEKVIDYGTPIVVDDGSSDNTSQISILTNAILIRHEVNRGYDAALETGIKKAIESGFKYAITIDADGQHDITAIDLIYDQLVQGADLVVGIRDKKQRFSELVFSILGNAIWKIRDPLCGLKGYSLAAVVKINNFNTYQSIGTELAIRLAISKANIKSVNVKTFSRQGESRFGNGIRANLKILKALILSIYLLRSSD